MADKRLWRTFASTTGFTLALILPLWWFLFSHCQRPRTEEVLPLPESSSSASSLMDIQSEPLVLRSVPIKEINPATTALQLRDPIPDMEKDLEDWLREPRLHEPISSGLQK